MIASEGRTWDTRLSFMGLVSLFLLTLRVVCCIVIGDTLVTAARSYRCNGN